MARKSQLDRAIEELEAKKADLLARVNGELNVIDATIQAIRQQQVKTVRRPRPVADPRVEKVG